MLNVRLLVLSMAFSMAGGASLAQDAVIGYVKTVQGDAAVLVAGKATKAQPGTPVQVGHVLKTGKQGSMGVTFTDNTIMSLGPDTEIAVDEYLFAPGKGDLKLGASMTRGSLNYVSGLIAKLKPESITLKTPTGTIGVRGTHFLAKVEAAD
ncbi:MAG: FecR domain-containing protein [Rhodoferax sp.]|nr:FecR domain-containing protein [Rhodoferax sp.]